MNNSKSKDITLGMYLGAILMVIIVGFAKSAEASCDYIQDNNAYYDCRDAVEFTRHEAQREAQREAEHQRLMNRLYPDYRY